MFRSLSQTKELRCNPAMVEGQRSWPRVRYRANNRLFIGAIVWGRGREIWQLPIVVCFPLTPRVPRLYGHGGGGGSGPGTDGGMSGSGVGTVGGSSTSGEPSSGVGKPPQRSHAPSQ
jgi:hypothetical protein